MSMYNPSHPGKIIHELCIKPLDLTITEAAEGLGISRNSLSEIVNGRTRISPEMAIRLSMAFGGDPYSWIMQQAQYDLWNAQQKRKKLHVKSSRKAS